MSPLVCRLLCLLASEQRSLLWYAASYHDLDAIQGDDIHVTVNLLNLT